MHERRRLPMLVLRRRSDEEVLDMLTAPALDILQESLVLVMTSAARPWRLALLQTLAVMKWVVAPKLDDLPDPLVVPDVWERM